MVKYFPTFFEEKLARKQKFRHLIPNCKCCHQQFPTSRCCCCLDTVSFFIGLPVTHPSASIWRCFLDWMRPVESPESLEVAVVNGNVFIFVVFKQLLVFRCLFIWFQSDISLYFYVFAICSSHFIVNVCWALKRRCSSTCQPGMQGPFRAGWGICSEAHLANKFAMKSNVNASVNKFFSI